MLKLEKKQPLNGHCYVVIPLVFLFYIAFHLWLYGGHILFDFAPLYTVGHLWRTGKGDFYYDYTMEEHTDAYTLISGERFTKYGLGIGFDEQVPLYLYCPTFIPLLSLISLFHYIVAKKIMLALESFSYVFALWLIIRLIFPQRQQMVAFVLIAFLTLRTEPVKWSIYSGQITPLLFLGMVSAFVLGERGKNSAAGVILGLMFWLKIFPGLLALYWLSQRRWQAIFSFFLTVLIFPLIGLLFFSPAVYKDYFALLRVMGTGVTVFSTNQSIESMLMRAITPITDAATVLTFLMPSWVKVLSFLLKLSLFLLLLLLWRRELEPPAHLVKGLFTIAFSCIVFSVAWSHYFILFIPLILLVYNLLLNHFPHRKMAKPLIIAVSLVVFFQFMLGDWVRLLANALISFFGKEAAAVLTKFLLSRQLLGGIFFLCFAYWLVGKIPLFQQASPKKS